MFQERHFELQMFSYFEVNLRNFSLHIVSTEPWIKLEYLKQKSFFFFFPLKFTSCGGLLFIVSNMQIVLVRYLPLKMRISFSSHIQIQHHSFESILLVFIYLLVSTSYLQCLLFISCQLDSMHALHKNLLFPLFLRALTLPSREGHLLPSL